MMAPSLRLAHPTSSTPRPGQSTSLIPSSDPSQRGHIEVHVPPTIGATARSVFVTSRVPTPGMHNSAYTSDANRSHIHLTCTKSLDLDPIDKLEFDGYSL